MLCLVPTITATTFFLHTRYRFFQIDFSFLGFRKWWDSFIENCSIGFTIEFWFQKKEDTFDVYDWICHARFFIGYIDWVFEFFSTFRYWKVMDMKPTDHPLWCRNVIPKKPVADVKETDALHKHLNAILPQWGHYWLDGQVTLYCSIKKMNKTKQKTK